MAVGIIHHVQERLSLDRECDSLNICDVSSQKMAIN